MLPLVSGRSARTVPSALARRSARPAPRRRAVSQTRRQRRRHLVSAASFSARGQLPGHAVPFPPSLRVSFPQPLPKSHLRQWLVPSVPSLGPVKVAGSMVPMAAMFSPVRPEPTWGILQTMKAAADYRRERPSFHALLRRQRPRSQGPINRAEVRRGLDLADSQGYRGRRAACLSLAAARTACAPL